MYCQSSYILTALLIANLAVLLLSEGLHRESERARGEGESENDAYLRPFTEDMRLLYQLSDFALLSSTLHFESFLHTLQLHSSPSLLLYFLIFQRESEASVLSHI